MELWPWRARPKRHAEQWVPPRPLLLACQLVLMRRRVQLREMVRDQIRAVRGRRPALPQNRPRLGRFWQILVEPRT